MYLTLNKNLNLQRFYLPFVAFLLFLIFLFINIPKSFAAGTLAGTSVTNQATATYKDDTGTLFNSSSNLVTISVSAIYGFTLTPSSTNTSTDANAQSTPGQRQNAIPGAYVYFPYTLTNTGNSPDSYTITTAVGGASTFTPTGIKVYIDANANGIIDVLDLQVTSTLGPIGPDVQQKLIVQYQVPSGASVGNLANVDIRATSLGNATLSDTRNYNRTTVVNDAAVTVAKSVDKFVANPLDDLTYNFSIFNNGNNKANPVEIIDTIPANTSFVVGSQVTVANGTFTFSNNGGSTYIYTPTGVTDPSVTHIKFRYDDPVNGFPLGNTRSVSFKLRVNSNAINVNINNYGVYEYTPSGSGVAVTGLNTNIVVTLVGRSSAAQISFSGSPFSGQTGSGTENPSTDTTTQASAPAGSYIYFKNLVTNNGNATDSFNITVSSSTFPASSTITFFKLTDSTTGENNTSPLLDTNSDSIVDTGLVDAGDNLTIVTRVFIPGNVNAGPYTAVIKSTSTNGGESLGTIPGQTISDETRNTVTSVVSSSSLFQNIVNGTPNSVTVTLTESSNGTTVSYPLNISNTGGTNDTFNLSAAIIGITGAGVQFYNAVTLTTLASNATAGATSVTLTNATGFSTGDKIIINGQTLTVGSIASNVVTFSSGQTLAFATSVNSTIVEPGSLTITSTGILASGANTNIIGVVSIPAGAPPYSTPNNITFTATSTNNNVSLSTVIDTLVIPTFINFTLNANRSGTAPAGGVLFYDHVLTNTGNIAETFNLNIPPVGASGFIYQVLDGATNVVITSSPAIAIGASYNFKVKVIIPNGTAIGTVENTELTAQETTSLQSKTNLDTTSVLVTFISLNKTAINTGPLGTASQPGNSAIPNDIIEYTIQYSNFGRIDALMVKIVDRIPDYTSFVSNSLKINGIAKTDANDNEGATGSADYNVSTVNSVTFFIGTVTPGQTGTVTFRIKLN